MMMMTTTKLQVAAGSDVTDPCNIEVKSVLEVFRLSDDHQIEAPAAAEISDDDCVDRP